MKAQTSPLSIKPSFVLIATVATLSSAHAQSVGYSGDGFDLANPNTSAALARLPATFTHIDNSSINTAASSGYSVLWLDGFSSFPGLSTAALDSFVINGGTLLVQSPGFGGNSLSTFPLGSQISQVTYTGGSGGEASVHIADSFNPITFGLTDAGLTWASPSALTASGHTSGSVGGFLGLIDDNTGGEWVTLVQKEGAGEIVYTYEDISRRLLDPAGDSQALDLLANILGTPTAVPEPCWATATTATLAATGMVLVRRHGRKSGKPV